LAERGLGRLGDWLSVLRCSAFEEIEMSDIPVTPRSNGDIERLAEGWRKALDAQDAWAPDILSLIERAAHEFEALQGLQIVFLPDEEMQDDEARAEFSPPRIYMRMSLESDARNNVPRARSTLAHELGHLLLHPGVPKFRKNAGNTSIANLPAFRSAEAQAWVFARAFLMPSWKVEKVNSAKELSLRCRVSLQIAEIRFAQFVRPGRRKVELPEVKTVIQKLRSAVQPAVVDPRVVVEHHRMRAWERARHIDGEDPAVARRSDDKGSGYRIERRQYGNALSPFGWFAEDGQALAYYGKDK
jgi:Zn-dependent peptidase ImmA (M78 family)